MLRHKISLILLIALAWLLCRTTIPVVAAPPQDDPQQDHLTYTVQPNDTLIKIALRYNLKLTDIVLANQILNPNLIFPGQQLTLPGVSFQATPVPAASPTPGAQFYTAQVDDSLFTIASNYGVSVGAILLLNGFSNPDLIQAGQVLKIPGGPLPSPELLPAPFVTIALSEPVITQGRTLVVKVSLSDSTFTSLSGQFEGSPLFFSQTNGAFWTIVPIHALAEPNIYPIMLTATRADGTQVNTFENVTVIEGPYGSENIQLDDSRGQLLDEELIRLEQEKLTNLWSRISLRPRWAGPFLYPVAIETLRITSYFGTRRSYNDSTELSFHGGTDFGGGVGRPIFAPAAGRVVLAEPLTVRGNAVLIDHGLGLFSGYWHQSELAVSEGQEVQAGDLIGTIGHTGLVTGPHLHWELRLNGIAVEPLQWVQQAIP
jgi:murein DD-endopeptidase MepM/ murein hydrolase activator NlpD